MIESMFVTAMIVLASAVGGAMWENKQHATPPSAIVVNKDVAAAQQVPVNTQTTEIKEK
jgi:hypothetical protein